ncbi:hypothetical protein O3P69_006337 [Scylla paramamosain]|uniref:Alpha-carbonic anhydrase domain-containing protein n=1 Tax=Scylla paramamosain TaxID=85552 RepID=A0AAW0U5N0_SCYPA
MVASNVLWGECGTVGEALVLRGAIQPSQPNQEEAESLLTNNTVGRLENVWQRGGRAATHGRPFKWGYTEENGEYTCALYTLKYTAHVASLTHSMPDPLLPLLILGWSCVDDDGIGPAIWPEKFPMCGGKRQSPVALVSKDALGTNPWIPFKFENYRETPTTQILINNGHTG